MPKASDVRVALYTRSVTSQRFNVNCRHSVTSNRQPSTAKSALFTCTFFVFVLDFSYVCHFFKFNCQSGCRLLIFFIFLQIIMLYWVLELARVFGLDGVTWTTSASFIVTVFVIGAKLQATNRVPRPVDRGTATRYGGQLRSKRVTSPDE